MSVVSEPTLSKDPESVKFFEEKIVNTQEAFINILKSKDSEIQKLNSKLQKKVLIEPKFATTKDAASFIGVNPSFLTKRQNKAFKQGIHFFKPEGESIVRWSITALSEWLTNDKNNTETTDTKLEKLLKRR